MVKKDDAVSECILEKADLLCVDAEIPEYLVAGK